VLATAERVHALLNAASIEAAHVVRFAASTGLRRSEIFVLACRDVFGNVCTVTNTGGLTLGFWSNSKHDGIWDQGNARGVDVPLGPRQRGLIWSDPYGAA
jgi:hypothetical protein